MTSTAPLVLVSSNDNKIAEYTSFGLGNFTIEKGRDLKEVEGDALEVILHKALEAGPNRIVEDTIMIVDGITHVDIRWKIGSVDQWFGKSAIWEVRLGVNRNGNIEVYKGATHGIIAPQAGIGTDFDPYFLIPEEGLSLAQLKQIGRKDEYSARKNGSGKFHGRKS